LSDDKTNRDQNTGQFGKGNQAAKGNKKGLQMRDKMVKKLEEIEKAGVDGIQFKKIEDLEARIIALYVYDLFYGTIQQMRAARDHLTPYLFAKKKTVDVRTMQQKVLYIMKGDNTNMLGHGVKEIKEAQKILEIEDNRESVN